ncbi:coiled-coil domain-containing protein 107 [Gastrophryne carolinensis]
MALSSSQHILLSVFLALCLCFLVPRMMGRGGDMAAKEPRRKPHPLHGRPLHKESPGKSQMRHTGPEKSFSSTDQIKSAMDQELKNEKTGGSRNLTFALMPMYAVGVALFAAYKFTKMKSKENGKSKSFQEDKNSEATEKQLVELEQHLLKTEQMLNSLLTQLDPLSSCVNTLAADQKNEIMNQLQSIRQLMKTSGIDRSALRNPANQTCNDTLDDLIHSFENRPCNIQETDENEESQLVETQDLAKESNDNYEHFEKPAYAADITENLDGLRKRNVKD